MATLQTSPSRALWLEAARPRTLPASIAPVSVGTAAAVSGRCLDTCAGTDWGRFGLALLVALSLQVAVNFANDYFDGIGGVDTEDRMGPRRLVASGLIDPPLMRAAMVGMLAVAALAGFALAAVVGWELLIVGVAALLAAIGYSGGPRPYASAGLGELFVFVFFGVVATAGSAYVQDESLRLLPLVASVPMGLLATALLVVNNLRDIPTDEAVGKVTLAVRLGESGTRTLFRVLALGALLGVAATAVVAGTAWVLLPLAALPLARPALRLVRAGRGPALIPALAATARLQLVVAALLAIGLALRPLGA